MDYHQFLSDTEDYLIPTKMNLDALPADCAAKIACYRGLKSSDVDISTFQNFVYAIGDYECLEGDMWRGRSAYAMKSIATEIIIQRGLRHIDMTPGSLLSCFSLEWVIDAWGYRPDQSSRLFNVLNDLPGAWVGGRYSPTVMGREVFAYLMAGGIKKLETD